MKLQLAVYYSLFLFSLTLTTFKHKTYPSIGETSNDSDSPTNLAVTYSEDTRSSKSLPSSLEGSYSNPEIIPTLKPVSNYGKRTFAEADELPGIVDFYNGDEKLNLVQINCTIYTAPHKCYEISTCGWCNVYNRCVRGDMNGPIDECPTGNYVFSLP